MEFKMEEVEKMGPQGKCAYVHCICSAHKLEQCHRCFYDFTELNANALIEATNEELLLCSAPGCLELSVSLCSGCSRVKYCGKPCQASHWKEHKKSCRVIQSAKSGAASNSDSSTPLRINLACYHLPDNFVDIFPVGTRLVMSSECTGVTEGNLRAKVVSFNPGRGPYINPEVKFDSKKYPDYSEDDLGTYTLLLKGGRDKLKNTLQTINCVDTHSDFIIE